MSICVGELVVFREFGLGLVEKICGRFASVKFVDNVPRYIQISDLALASEEQNNSVLASTLKKPKRKVGNRTRQSENFEGAHNDQSKTRKNDVSNEQEYIALKIKELWTSLVDRFKNNFLDVEQYYQTSCADFISFAEFEREKISFVRQWFLENSPTNTDRKNLLPDDEQIAAIASVNGNIQVTARAGSGKTTTLVNRAFFLIRHCGISGPQLLLLAFNRKAVHDIRKKLFCLMDVNAKSALDADIERRLNSLGNQKIISRDEIESNAIEFISRNMHIELPHVLTFHALARSLVHSDLHRRGIDAPKLLVDTDSDKVQSNIVQAIIDNYLRDSTGRVKIRDVMLSHFREDWERIIEGHYDKNQVEFLEYRRSIPRKSLAGAGVKSFGEKVIADFLFEHNIPYEYEKNFWADGFNYQPDFSIETSENSGIVIEYFGLKGDIAYDENIVKKREFWKSKEDWNLLEFYPQDLTIEGIDFFRSKLKEHLLNLGVQSIKLSEEEIWEKVKARSIDSFSNAIKSWRIQFRSATTC